MYQTQGQFMYSCVCAVYVFMCACVWTRTPHPPTPTNRFTPHLQRVNDGMQAYAADKPGVTYVYCGDVLLEPNGHLNQLLIPDALHPNGQGAWIHGRGGCICTVLYVEHRHTLCTNGTYHEHTS